MVFLLTSALILILVLAGVLIWVGMPKGPSVEDVAHLARPEIREMAPQKVLLVRARGAPGATARRAFGLLTRTYFRLKDVPKRGRVLNAFRARWPVGEGLPQDQWEGHFAIPVSEEITEVPPGSQSGELTVTLETWEYGEVAQVLHVGRYDAEEITVERLREFIRSQGYEIAGPHEEEYLKGPGLLFSGNPERYLTMVRYRVRRTGTAGGTEPARGGGRAWPVSSIQ